MTRAYFSIESGNQKEYHAYENKLHFSVLEVENEDIIHYQITVSKRKKEEIKVSRYHRKEKFKVKNKQQTITKLQWLLRFAGINKEIQSLESELFHRVTDKDIDEVFDSMPNPLFETDEELIKEIPRELAEKLYK